jgi:hypothetical protein
MRDVLRQRLSAHGVAVLDGHKLAHFAHRRGQQTAWKEALDSATGQSNRALINKLMATPTGWGTFADFETIVQETLSRLFIPPLTKPMGQVQNSSRSQRRDLLFPNRAEAGFWGAVRRDYDCALVTVDAKNHRDPLLAEEVRRFEQYLGTLKAGNFGILVTRRGLSDAAVTAQREIWTWSQKMVIELSERDLISLLNELDQGTASEDLLYGKVEELRSSV